MQIFIDLRRSRCTCTDCCVVFMTTDKRQASAWTEVTRGQGIHLAAMRNFSTTSDAQGSAHASRKRTQSRILCLDGRRRRVVVSLKTWPRQYELQCALSNSGNAWIINPGISALELMCSEITKTYPLLYQGIRKCCTCPTSSTLHNIGPCSKQSSELCRTFGAIQSTNSNKQWPIKTIAEEQRLATDW